MQRPAGEERPPPAVRNCPWNEAPKAGDPVYTAFAISFPASRSGTAVAYTVNNVYSDEYGGTNESDA